jgi:CelD/BcsL family acetyltransferase involved in cellulose biosynthesis
MLRPVLLDGVEEFARLEDDWDNLVRSVATYHYTQTFEWAKLGWETRDASAGDRLFCATIWSGARLVAVWPFQRNRLGFATRLEPLGCGMHEEYGDPLIAPDVDPLSVCRELMALVRPMADIVEVPFVQHDGAIRTELLKAGWFNVVTPLRAYVLETRGAESFDALLQTYSANFRADLKRKRKRLQKLGQLRFELPEDIASCTETIDWVIEEKRQWLQRHDKANPWLPKGEVRAFFVAAAAAHGEFGRVGLFRLTLDGAPIAAFLATIDETRIEMFVTSFAPEYGRFSPGMLIIEDVVRWGVERGLDFDMRILHMDYKERWANSSLLRVKHRVALTPAGACLLLPEYLSLSMRALLRSVSSAEQRENVRRILKWRPKFGIRSRPSVPAVDFRAIQEE